MTEVLSSSSSHFPSPSSSSLSSYTPTPNDGAPQTPQTQPHHHSLIYASSPVDNRREEEEDKQGGDQFPLLAILVTVFRKYMVTCSTETKEVCSMEIGVPTDVRHVAHVTFDRFNGFLGLPVEFEPEVPRRAPSASATVFGVSTESMQCSYDSRGNSVPTILLLMQRHMYAQGGLQAEGIFRINADNSQEDYVRDQLNRGVVPDDVEVHCLAGLIKAWFRELPTGVLDPLEPEQVMQCQSEDECAQLVRLLPPSEAALLDWAINLMADVVQEEHHNKMNARNVAMVFAPNMTQMVDPLTALMHAVQVMNFLRTLIERTLRQRQDSIIDSSHSSPVEPSDDNGNHSPSQPRLLEESSHEEEKTEHAFVADKAVCDSSEHRTEDDFTSDSGSQSSQISVQKAISDTNRSTYGDCSCNISTQPDTTANEQGTNVTKTEVQVKTRKCKTSQPSNADMRRGSRKLNMQPVVGIAGAVEKSRGVSIVSRINSRMERIEAWR